MVSQQEGTFYSRKRDLTIYGEEEFHNTFKKIKQEDDQSQSTLFNEQPNSKSMKKRSITFDFELHLHTPLPSKRHSRKSKDHSTNFKDHVIVEQPKISLDLELNLSPSYSPSTKVDESLNLNESISSKGKDLTNSSNKKSVNRSLSWLAFEGDDDHKEQEMVTKVCMKCHMLVMLSTSTPVCPNCKFMHPHDHSSTKMFKPSNNLLSLLC